MSIEAKIISAIQSKRVIVIGYSGSRREVEPHLLGVNAKGNKCLSAFQTAGGSAASWRAFLVEKITSVELLDDQFDVRKGYNPNDSTMSVIIERV